MNSIDSSNVHDEVIWFPLRWKISLFQCRATHYCLTASPSVYPQLSQTLWRKIRNGGRNCCQEKEMEVRVSVQSIETFWCVSFQPVSTNWHFFPPVAIFGIPEDLARLKRFLIFGFFDGAVGETSCVLITAFICISNNDNNDGIGRTRLVPVAW